MTATQPQRRQCPHRYRAWFYIGLGTFIGLAIGAVGAVAAAVLFL